MNGYIKLYRSLMENPLWNDKPFSKGQAWIDLLFLTNWKDTKRIIDNGERVIHEGDLIVSQVWLAERWGWSRKKVSCFLTFLEHSGNIRILGTSKRTALHVENYTRYQDDGAGKRAVDEQLMSSQGAHIKKEKKEKNIKEIFIKEKSKEKNDASILQVQHKQFAGILKELRK